MDTDKTGVSHLCSSASHLWRFSCLSSVTLCLCGTFLCPFCQEGSYEIVPFRLQARNRHVRDARDTDSVTCDRAGRAPHQPHPLEHYQPPPVQLTKPLNPHPFLTILP